MFLPSCSSLPAEVFHKSPRASLIALNDATHCGLDANELRLDWRHAHIDVAELLKTLKPGWRSQAKRVLQEDEFSRKGLAQHLDELKALIASAGIDEAAHRHPLALIVHDDGYDVQTFAALLIVADDLKLKSAPIYIARADTVGRATWEYEHVR